jgi:iron complex outermembrane recepter protein
VVNSSRLKTVFVCFLAIEFVLWSGAAAQTPATVSGFVTDVAGTGLSGATITLTASGSSAVHTARTDGSGRYGLENISPGAYTAEIRSGGLVLHRTVRLAAGSNTQDFQLHVGQFAEILTITAQKREEPIERAPVAVSAMSGSELQAAGITQVTELSDFVPNLHMTNAGGRATINYLGLRGFLNSNQTVDPSMSIYVDGVPVTDFFSTAQTLFDVERIEVIKGPQGTLYGVNSLCGHRPLAASGNQRPGCLCLDRPEGCG